MLCNILSNTIIILVCRWRVCFALSTIPAVVLAVAMQSCAESPEWLFKVMKHVLFWHSADVKNELVLLTFTSTSLIQFLNLHFSCIGCLFDSIMMRIVWYFLFYAATQIVQSKERIFKVVGRWARESCHGWSCSRWTTKQGWFILEGFAWSTVYQRYGLNLYEYRRLLSIRKFDVWFLFMMIDEIIHNLE